MRTDEVLVVERMVVLRRREISELLRVLAE